MAKQLPSFRSILITILLAAAVVSLTRSIVDLWSRRSIIYERERDLAAIQKDNATLKKKLMEVVRPEFVEKEARERLGMAKEGETIILLDQSVSGKRNPDGTPADIPNWKQWWNLFF